MPGVLTEIFKEFKEFFLEIFSFIIMGSNKLSKKQMYNYMGRQIQINKNMHRVKRQIEFCIRICIIDFTCHKFII